MKREPTEKEYDQIDQAIFAGDRVEAINVYISITECGLTEAQKFVARRTEELKRDLPDKFSARASKKKLFGIFRTE